MMAVRFTGGRIPALLHHQPSFMSDDPGSTAGGDLPPSSAHSPFQPPAAPGVGQRVSWRGLQGSAAALAVAATTRARQNLTLVVAADSAGARRWVIQVNRSSGPPSESTSSRTHWSWWESPSWPSCRRGEQTRSQARASLGRVTSRKPHGHTSTHLPHSSHWSSASVKYMPGPTSSSFVKQPGVQNMEHCSHPKHDPQE